MGSRKANVFILGFIFITPLGRLAKDSSYAQKGNAHKTAKARNSIIIWRIIQSGIILDFTSKPTYKYKKRASTEIQNLVCNFGLTSKRSQEVVTIDSDVTT
jgi:hypothetical protein